MRLKIYQAPNMGAAMALVRDELGPDALILSSQTTDAGVEVRAALDPTLDAVAHAAVDDTASAVDLAWHGVSDELRSNLSTTSLPSDLERELRFGTLPCSVGTAPLMLIGPPGAGKTMTAARLATRLKLAGYNACMITADGRRAGAAEQLAAVTRLLGLTLTVAGSAAQLARAIARRKDDAPVVVDMPGLNPFEPADQNYVLECRAAAGAAIALVLPAGLDANDALELALGFRALGASLLIATRLDQSRRLGGILNAAAIGLILTDAGIGTGIADALVPMSASFLAERLRCGRLIQLPPPAPLSPLAMLAGSKSELPRTPS